ncbi:MAG: zf-TFIIB domain-containing protein [Hyphomonadaceae bacterium]
MPLLMCPNCNASMNEVKRGEVAFDMCPTCRGIWLDRGELEKILEGARSERQEFDRDREQFYRDPDQYRRAHPEPPPRYDNRQDYGERGEYGQRGEGGYDPRTGRRRRGGFDFFDIFD